MTRRSISNSNVLSKTSGALGLIETSKWTRVEALEAHIRPTLDLPLNRIEAKRIAQQLGVHWTTVYRYRRGLLNEGVATTILGRGRGFPVGSSRLTPEHEAIIDDVIGRLARGPTKLRVIDVLEEVEQRCRRVQLRTPSRSAIDRRLQQMAPAHVVRRKVDDNRQTSTATGTFIIRKPFDVAQIDHTKSERNDYRSAAKR